MHSKTQQNSHTKRALITNSFWSGVGSLLSIYPNTDYAQFVSKQTANERMQSHWDNVGQSLHNSIEQVSSGITQEK